MIEDDIPFSVQNKAKADPFEHVHVVHDYAAPEPAKPKPHPYFVSTPGFSVGVYGYREPQRHRAERRRRWDLGINFGPWSFGITNMNL